MSARNELIVVPRLILCHKQKTSARLRFLRFAHGMLAFDALPEACSIHAALPSSEVSVHPAAWVRQAAEQLGIDPHILRAEPGFHAEARAGAQRITILMACFASEDPPFEAAHRNGAHFISITEARTVAPQELALLRLAYEYLIG